MYNIYENNQCGLQAPFQGGLVASPPKISLKKVLF